MILNFLGKYVWFNWNGLSVVIQKVLSVKDFDKSYFESCLG